MPVSKEPSERRLAAVVMRSKELHAIVNSELVAAAVGRVDSLPSLPRAYLELRELTSRDDTRAAEIAKAVESDPALSLKLLQIVNSVGFGMRQRVASVQQAGALLGLEQIKGIVLTAQIFTSAAKVAVPSFSLAQFEDCSIRIARVSQQFMSSRNLGDEAFTAGLLHDVGKLVLAMTQPELFASVLARLAETREAAEVVERELIGVTHSEAGAYLLWSWGLPLPIAEAVAFHHQSDFVTRGRCELVAAVHAADALWDIHGGGEPESKLDLALLVRAGVVGELEGWRMIVKKSLA